MTDDTGTNPHESGGFTAIIAVVFAIMLLLVLMMWMPGWLAEAEYKHWSDMGGRSEVPFTGTIIRISERPCFGGLARLDYNTSMDDEIRVVERVDYGGIVPIKGKEVLNQTVSSQNLTYYWSYNPCVPTHVYVLHATTYEHGVLPQTCMCG